MYKLTIEWYEVCVVTRENCDILNNGMECHLRPPYLYSCLPWQYLVLFNYICYCIRFLTERFVVQIPPRPVNCYSHILCQKLTNFFVAQVNLELFRIIWSIFIFIFNCLHNRNCSWLLALPLGHLSAEFSNVFNAYLYYIVHCSRQIY